MAKKQILQADFHATVAWTEQHDLRWAFSDRNAGAYLADFFCTLDDLNQINWIAVRENNWSDPLIKEGKQAEFLVYEAFPWMLVEKVGVVNAEIQARVQQILRHADHRPPVAVKPSWYYQARRRS